MNKRSMFKQGLAILLAVVLGITTIQVEIVHAEEDSQAVMETETSTKDIESEENSDNEEESVSQTVLEDTEEHSGFTSETTVITIADETVQTNEIESVTNTETEIETETSDESLAIDESGAAENMASADETEAVMEETGELEEETKETEAVIMDTQTSVPSNMKEECLPYLLWYCEQKDSIVMGGTTYTDAIEFSVFGDDDIRAGFNLNGIYKSVSFSVGHIDGMGANAKDIVLKIYRDNVEKERFSLSNNDIPQSITCNVEGTRQLEFVFEATGSRYNPSYFGIGALNFSREGNDTCIGKVINSNMKEQDCLPYNLKYCELKDSIVMGGTRYTDAIEFSVFGDDDIRAGFNLNGIYKTISFSVGHIDGMGASAEDIVLKIYKDNVEKENYALSNNNIPKSIICRVDGTRQLEFIFEAKGSRYNPSYFGIGAINFSKEAAVETPTTVSSFNINSTAEGIANQPFTTSGTLTLSGNGPVTLEDFQNEADAVTWTSTDESIAKLTSCKATVISPDNRSATLQLTITPYKAGPTTITGKTSNNLTASCKVTVKSQTTEPQELFTDFKIELTDTNIGVPNELIEAVAKLTLKENLNVSTSEIKGEINKISWSSSDFYVASATIDDSVYVNGNIVEVPVKIWCFKDGTATITGTTSNGLKAECEVTVKSETSAPEGIFSDFSIDPVGEIYGPVNMLINATGRFVLANEKVSSQEIQREIDAINWSSAASGTNPIAARVTGCGTATITGRIAEFPITIKCLREGKSSIVGKTSNNIEASCQITFHEGAVVTYTVYFDTKNRGTAPAPYENVMHGSVIKAPAEPKAQGYVFTGWYKDYNCTSKWDFEKDVVTSEMTLYADWKVSGGSDDDSEGVLPEDIPSGGIPDGLWLAGVSDYMYTGKPVRQQVRVYYNDVRLKEGWDYTVSYKNNTKAASSTDRKAPKIIIKAKNGYKGTMYIPFTIRKSTLTRSNLIYTATHIKGKTNTPVIILYGNILKSNTDYTLTYTKNGRKVKTPTKPGSYEIHIKGKNGCVGEFSVPYTILDGDTISIAKAKVGISSMTYGGEIPRPALTINGQTLRENTDYTVTYVNTNAKGTATAVFQGKGSYSGVLKKTFKVKAASLPSGCITVTGNTSLKKGGAKPQVTVRVNGVKLIAGIDYTVSYKNNKKAGRQATVTVKGKGNYSGTQKTTFTVRSV